MKVLPTFLSRQLVSFLGWHLQECLLQSFQCYQALILSITCHYYYYWKMKITYISEIYGTEKNFFRSLLKLTVFDIVLPISIMTKYLLKCMMCIILSSFQSRDSSGDIIWTNVSGRTNSGWIIYERFIL